jgi:hypothetical protein
MGATKELTLRQKAFLDYYTNIATKDSHGIPTFGNASRSYALAFGRKEVDGTAGTQSYRLMKNPAIKTELEQICENLGWDVKVRLGQLASIASGKHTKTAISRTYTHEKGKRRRLVATQETEVPTKDSDRLRAIVIANKVTGVDAVGSAMRAIATEESKRLYNRIVRPKGNK